MKTGGLKLIMQAAALAILMPVAAHAGDVNAKLELCQSCHGLSYQGYWGYLVTPRLAGQTPEYIKSQLQAFAERKRERGIFFNMARTHKSRPACKMRWRTASRVCTSNPLGAAPSISWKPAGRFTRTELQGRMFLRARRAMGNRRRGRMSIPVWRAKPIDTLSGN